MSNKNYDWIKSGVHAWVEGLVCPVEVEVVDYNYQFNWIDVECGILFCEITFSGIYQTEAECLEVMRNAVK